MCFEPGSPYAGAVLVTVGAAAVVIVAALTSWWLLALLPVVMMVGCMVMMAGSFATEPSLGDREEVGNELWSNRPPR